MDQRWTLHVENFARIGEADIEISPLMCFIGDNNSGKSYMMSLLWGILANGYMIYYDLQNPDGHFATETYNRCNDWFSSNIGKTATITDDVEKMYIDWFNELLGKYKKKILNNVFNFDIDAKKIEIRNFSRRKKISIRLHDFSKGKSLHIAPSDEKHEFILSMDLGVVPQMAYNFFVCWILLMENLTRINPSLAEREAPIYLPASRTGFMLTYPQIASTSMGAYYSLRNNNDRSSETLTAPYIQFLQLLIKLKESTNELEDEKKESLIEFLNHEIINGTLVSKENGRMIRYQADDMNDEIPMSVTSSVVTEIASLLLLLKTKVPLRLMIIEEPEAHLHPALQKRIAQLLIRFIHSGVPIWITTHSDIILQHFNNMIKLNHRPEEERSELLDRFHYAEEDLLSLDEIKLYQFSRENEKTIITALQTKKYGFIAPSFNKAMDDLMQEIFAFQETDS